VLDRRRRLLAMVGELLREAGLLVGVLGPLESLIGGHGLTTIPFMFIVVITGLCLGVGLYLGVDNDA
jgi:hypothetical protein